MSTDIVAFLTWVIGFGGPAAAAALLSYLAENAPWWSKLSSTVKFIIPLVVSVALSFGASLLLKYPDLLAQIQPWFQILMSAVLAYIASQKTYQDSLKSHYGKRWSKSMRGGILEEQKGQEMPGG